MKKISHLSLKKLLDYKDLANEINIKAMKGVAVIENDEGFTLFLVDDQEKLQIIHFPFLEMITMITAFGKAVEQISDKRKESIPDYVNRIISGKKSYLKRKGIKK